MLHSCLITLLVFISQILLCIAAGGSRGKEPAVPSFASYYNQQYQEYLRNPTVEHQPLRSDLDNYSPLDIIQKINAYCPAIQRELLCFARGHLQRRKMTKEEWDEFQQQHPETTKEIWLAYRAKKNSNKLISNLRAKAIQRPEEYSDFVEKAQNAGFKELDLVKGGELSKMPGFELNKARIKDLMLRIRREIADINQGMVRKKRQLPWKELEEDGSGEAHVLKLLNEFRNTLRRDPYDPHLEMMRDNIDIHLKSILGRRYKPIELPMYPPGHQYREQGGSSHQATGQFDEQQQHIEKDIADEEGDLHHHPSITDLDEEQDHHSQNQWNPHLHHPDQGYVNYHHPDMESFPHEYPTNAIHQQQNLQDYTGHQVGQEYAHLQTQMDHMQLHPPGILSEAEIKKLDPHQRIKFFKGLFYSDDESEEE